MTWQADETILLDFLIDAGHGIIPFLIKHGNRIPDAMVITHPHFDHILGMDWIIQSYFFRSMPGTLFYPTTAVWKIGSIMEKKSLIRFLLKFGDNKQ